MQKTPHEYIVLALDNCENCAQLETLIKSTTPYIGTFKIGLEQYVRFGAPIVELAKKSGRSIFLDLKFHDIPNTVAQAVTAAADLGVDYLTVHTQGGIEMMRAAKQAALQAQQQGKKRPAIIGVTILTSISQEALSSELNVGIAVADQVRHLAACAVAAGIDGIVCSAADLPTVKPVLPHDFIVITPGIRPAGSDVNDQKRIATPAEAVANGATLLVIGRPITGAKDPAMAAKAIGESLV